MDIRSAHRLAWENKLAQGSDTTDAPLESCPQGAVVAKLAKNQARTCRQLPSGVMLKPASGSPPG